VETAWWIFLAELRAGGDLKAGVSSSDIDRPFGANAAVASQGLKERDLREVSAYSTVYSRLARRTAYPHCPSYSIRYHTKMKSDRPPR
jgi:hypothetical protein